MDIIDDVCMQLNRVCSRHQLEAVLDKLFLQICMIVYAWMVMVHADKQRLHSSLDICSFSGTRTAKFIERQLKTKHGISPDLWG